MEKFTLSKTLENGKKIDLYMDTYGINYCITVFTNDYRVIETRKTNDYFHSLHLLTILENKYSK